MLPRRRHRRAKFISVLKSRKRNSMSDIPSLQEIKTRNYFFLCILRSEILINLSYLNQFKSLSGGAAVKNPANFTDISRWTWLGESECITDAAKRQLKLHFYIYTLWIIKPGIQMLLKKYTDGGLSWRGIKGEVRQKENEKKERSRED